MFSKFLPKSNKKTSKSANTPRNSNLRSNSEDKIAFFLPIDLLRTVSLAFTDPKDVVALTFVNKHTLNSMYKDEFLWKSMFARELPGIKVAEYTLASFVRAYSDIILKFNALLNHKSDIFNIINVDQNGLSLMQHLRNTYGKTEMQPYFDKVYNQIQVKSLKSYRLRLLLTTFGIHLSQSKKIMKVFLSTTAYLSEVSQAIKLAIKLNHVATIEAIVELNLPITSTGSEDETLPIHDACENGNLEIVQLLYKYTPEHLRQEDSYHQTCISHAARSGNVELLKFLISKNMPLDVQRQPRLERILYPESDDFGIAPTPYAEEYVTDEYTGFTPLMWAINGKHVAATKLLIESGADINLETIDHKKPIHIACKSGNLEIVSILLKTDPSHLNVADENGCTPLIYAIKEKQVAVVEYLLKEIKTQQIDLTQAIQPMMNDPKGFAANHNYFSLYGSSALHFAAMIGDEKIIQLLVAAGANLEAKNSAEETPLLIAAGCGKQEAVKALLNAGANLEAVNIRGNTALHIAVLNRQMEIARILIKHKANIAARNLKNKTPTEEAKNKHDKTIMKLLTWERMFKRAPVEIKQKAAHKKGNFFSKDIVTIGEMLAPTKALRKRLFESASRNTLNEHMEKLQHSKFKKLIR